MNFLEAISSLCAHSEKNTYNFHMPNIYSLVFLFLLIS